MQYFFLLAYFTRDKTRTRVFSFTFGIMKFRILLLFLLSCAVVLAQPGRDEALANSYYQNGEFEKAVELYQDLWEKNNNSPVFYTQLFKCYENLKQFDALEKVVKKQIKRYEDNPVYQIDLGYVYTGLKDAARAKEQFEKVLKLLPANEPKIRTIATAFQAYGQHDYAIAAFIKGGKLLKNEQLLGFDLANAYTLKGDLVNAAKLLLQRLEFRPDESQQIKNYVQNARDGGKLMGEIETQLYAKAQRGEDNESLNDFLIWIYIQNKDFEGALMQSRAIDKRKQENGFRVLSIARMAATEEFYTEAISGYEYIIAKGRNSPLYFLARTELLNCRKQKIAKTLNYSLQDLEGLKADYLSFINESGRGPQAAASMKELADLEGFYLHNIDSAISLCEEILKMNGVPQQVKNQTKLSLGDFYLIDGDVWESNLMYSQVDKDEKDSPLGEEARYRNAKLSYYKGDFEWAATQLEVLKASTTELIANDAINLAVFIIDNTGMDTFLVPVEMFARAELFMFQNKDVNAFSVLDSIKRLYPGHALFDDIEYTEARLYVKQKQFDKAVPLLEDIITNFKSDLKGDDATFLLAEINEQQLGNKDKAKELYQRIITDYNSSLLVLEARKRFRVLRGDRNN
jgi:tetratricopeptide (TPR) repeat protein